MGTTTRRELLRGMASLPAFAALSGCRSFKTDAQHQEAARHQYDPQDSQAVAGQLNVCLHGLWYVELRNDGIILYAPTVPDHVYRAGGWKQEADLDPKLQFHELKGLGTRKVSPAIDDQRYPVLSATPTPDRAQMSAVVKVPFPDEIHGLRCVRRTPTDASFYAAGKYAPRQDLMYLPMNLILVYRLAPASTSPYLEGTSWKGTRSLHYPTNLHFRAEPLRTSMMDAQLFLCRALGITDLKELEMNAVWKKTGRPPVDPVKPLYGYDRDEELGLAELFPLSRSGTDMWDDATFAEIPQLESAPCKTNSDNTASPSNCSHVIGRNHGG